MVARATNTPLPGPVARSKAQKPSFQMRTRTGKSYPPTPPRSLQHQSWHALQYLASISCRPHLLSHQRRPSKSPLLFLFCLLPLSLPKLTDPQPNKIPLPINHNTTPTLTKPSYTTPTYSQSKLNLSNLLPQNKCTQAHRAQQIPHSLSACIPLIHSKICSLFLFSLFIHNYRWPTCKLVSFERHNNGRT